METIKQETEEIDDGELEKCQDISPKNCSKLHFSIAQIMGFDTSDTAQPVNSDTTLENTQKLESSQEQCFPPLKLCRPQPNPQNLPNPVQFPQDPATLAPLRLSIFRSNKITWRSKLLSSYVTSIETFQSTPNFVCPSFPLQDPSKFDRGPRSSLGFSGNEKCTDDSNTFGKVEPVMQRMQIFCFILASSTICASFMVDYCLS